jgi:hypothetical protein
MCGKSCRAVGISKPDTSTPAKPLSMPKIMRKSCATPT